jgi:hypothetical protein
MRYAGISVSGIRNLGVEVKGSETDIPRPADIRGPT